MIYLIDGNHFQCLNDRGEGLGELDYRHVSVVLCCTVLIRPIQRIAGVGSENGVLQTEAEYSGLPLCVFMQCLSECCGNCSAYCLWCEGASTIIRVCI